MSKINQPKLYVGWSESTTSNEEEPNFMIETVSDQFDECLFNTAWALESRGLISSEDAENMDIDLADQIGIHVMGINGDIINELNSSLNALFDQSK